MTKEQAYDSLINPLMAQIISICKEHKIPMLASFTLDGDEGLQCTTALLHEDWAPHEKLVSAAAEIMGEAARKPLVLTTKPTANRPPTVSRKKSYFE